MVKYVYLNRFDGSGVPENLNTNMVTNSDISVTISSDVLNEINETLPNGRNNTVIFRRPNWVRNSDIKIKESCNDAYVTFLSEGAGYRNSLGYYVYKKNERPRRFQDINDVYIIFPNASLPSKGGNLNSSSRIHIPYKVNSTVEEGGLLYSDEVDYIFPKDTRISFVIFSNGWRSNKVRVNHNMYSSNFLTNPEPNKVKKFHFMNYKSKYTNEVIYGVEDLYRNHRSDDDYNDCVFMFTCTPFENIDSSCYNSFEVQEDYGTIFCEDLHYNKVRVDRDYNDFICEFFNKEYLNSEGKISSIKLTTIGKHRGASLDHEFGIIIPNIKSLSCNIFREVYVGETQVNTLEDITEQILNSGSDRIAMISSTKNFLPSGSAFTNTVSSSTIVPVSQSSIRILFNEPISRDEINGLYSPYRIYLKIYLDSDTYYYYYNDVDYPNVSSEFTVDKKPKIFYEKDLLNWRPPLEKMNIIRAYPKVVGYFNSGFNNHIDWYHPKKRVDYRCFETIDYTLRENHPFFENNEVICNSGDLYVIPIYPDTIINDSLLVSFGITSVENLEDYTNDIKILCSVLGQITVNKNKLYAELQGSNLVYDTLGENTYYYLCLK